MHLVCELQHLSIALETLVASHHLEQNWSAVCAKKAQKTTAMHLPDKYHKGPKKIITFFYCNIFDKQKKNILILNMNWSEWIPTGETIPFSYKTLACLVIKVIYSTSKKGNHSKSKLKLVRLDFNR